MTQDVLLTIAYSTLAARARNLAPAEPHPGLEVLLCVQGGPLPDEHRPPGARVVDVAGTGVARSRNAAIEHARGRYLLFCDDDVQVDLAGVLAGIDHLRATGHALALGRALDPTGALRKRYPQPATRLTLFNSAKAATYEMLIDLGQIRAKGMEFDVRFGAGTDLHLGDEYIFIAELLRSGLTAEAVPLVFGTHPSVSSGSTWGSGQDSHARAVALNRVFGRWAVCARLAFGWKNRSMLGGWPALLAFVRDNAGPPPLTAGGSPPPKASGPAPTPWDQSQASGA